MPLVNWFLIIWVQSFLEPIKASQDKQAQDKQTVHDVGHAEVGLPDLSVSYTCTVHIS